MLLAGSTRQLSLGIRRLHPRMGVHPYLMINGVGLIALLLPRRQTQNVMCKSTVRMQPQYDRTSDTQTPRSVGCHCALRLHCPPFDCFPRARHRKNNYTQLLNLKRWLYDEPLQLFFDTDSSV